MSVLAHCKESTPMELITAMTIRPYPGRNYPALPSLPTEIATMACYEIEASATVRNAISQLNSKLADADKGEAVYTLETQKAIGCLQACLTAPNVNLHDRALVSIANLNNPDAIPFLIIYAYYMSISIDGSESATDHGMIHQRIARTLRLLTGVRAPLTSRGQDPEGLKKGIVLWTRAYLNMIESKAEPAPSRAVGR